MQPQKLNDASANKDSASGSKVYIGMADNMRNRNNRKLQKSSPF
jgi:hypothetical protein